MLIKSEQNSATALGGAILLWSTTVAINRSLAEQLGPITVAAALHIHGRAVVLLLIFLRRKRFNHLLGLPTAYLGSCGSLFVLSQICVFMSVGSAANRQQAIASSMVYYLWPGLTLIFSIPI